LLHFLGKRDARDLFRRPIEPRERGAHVLAARALLRPQDGGQ
jgi:hypothetical protein